MNYELIKPINPLLSVKQQIAWNRGIDPIDYEHFMNVSSRDLFVPEDLGREKLEQAGKLLHEAIDNNQNVAVVVD